MHEPFSGRYAPESMYTMIVQYTLDHQYLYFNQQKKQFARMSSCHMTMRLYIIVSALNKGVVMK